MVRQMRTLRGRAAVPQPAMPRPASLVKRRRVNLAIIGLLALCGAMAAACTPRIQQPGPPSASARLSDDIIVAPDGALLPLRIWAPQAAPRAVILALHGFNDYSNAFDDAGRFWAEHGILTYAYDQRGFGGAPNRGYWAGTDAYVGDLRIVARLLRERHPGAPFYILGESMGGAILMVAMTGAAPPQTDGIILVAPAVWGRAHMPIYQTASLWMAAHLIPWMRVTGEGLDIRPSDNVEMLRKFVADPMVLKETRIDAVHGLVDLMDAAHESAAKLTSRSLILYGMRDEVVPDSPTFAMLASLARDNGQRHKVIVYSRGYHMLLRDLQAGTVMRDIASWIAPPDRLTIVEAESPFLPIGTP